MLLSNRRTIFSLTRGNKASRRRNRRDSSHAQRTSCGLAVEALEARQMLSALAAFQPAIVVMGRVAAPGLTPHAASPATQASAPYTPAQIATAYGVNRISFGNVVGNGAGQTIAIVDAYNDPNIVSDTATFNSQFNLPQFNVTGGPAFTVLNQTGGTTPPSINGQGWDLEESLDVQWAHSMAPQANIILYESNTNNDSDMDAAVATAAANPAVSVVSMSWGEGEFTGEQSEDPFVLTPTSRTGGVTFLAAAGDGGSPAIYPATSPDVVSVGGTSLIIQTDGTYTSESVWNNNNGNATGGGVSSLESQPAYQVGNVNGASTTNRAVPDVSMDADPYTGVYVLDNFSGGWFQVGGTSLSTPLWAGLIADANQGRALNGQPSLNGLTQTLPTLYNLPSSDFNDITVGSNGTFSATPGYDLVTGRGTPIANLLVQDLANSTINWSPTASGPASATTNQNSPLTFSGSNAITLTDQIAGTNTDSLALSVNDGSLALGSTSGLTFTSGANGSASMTVSGSISQLEAAVAGLTYTPNTGYSGADSLSVLLSDPLANVSASASVALTVNAPPTISAPASASLNENGSLVFSTAGGNAISVADAAAGAGADSLTLSVTNGTLTLGSTSGLSFTSGANGGASFTVTGTVTDLDNALNGLTYQPTALFVGSDSLSISITDSPDSLSASTSVGLTIIALAPPSIGAPATGSVTENGSLVFSTTNSNAISVTDSGAGSNADSLTLSVVHGTLTLASTAGLSFTGTNGSSSFTVSGTVANLDAALNGLTYQPTALFVGSDSLAVGVADPGDTLTASTSVALTVNVAPPAITAPLTASATENGSLAFSSANSNAISFTDVNAGTSKTESLTLSVAHGTLTLGSTTGLTFKTGKNSTASFTVTGTVASLNTALSGLTYKPTALYTGADSLAISVADPGNGQSSSTSVALTVSALSPPSITAPAAGSLGENLSLTFSTANSNAISVADVNAGTKADTLTLSVTNGTLTLGATPGLTFKAGKNGTATFTISATLANLNTALNGLTYKPTSGYSGPDSIAISILDPADGQSASGSVTLTVNAATAPVITAPATASLSENSSQVFSTANSNAISFTDANAGTSKTESLKLSVTHGTLKLSTTSGLTVTAGANNSASMTVTGTVSSLDAALNGLTYKPTTGYSGSDSLAISVADPGDSLSASTSVALTVTTTPPAFTAPATATVAENGSLVFSKTNSNAVSIADINAGTAVEQLTLTATNGTLKLGSTTGITFISGANKSATMTISGTLTSLNNALKNLTFTPTTGYTGAASIALSYTDVGNGLTASANIAVTVGSGAGPTSLGGPSNPQTVLVTSPPPASGIHSTSTTSSGEGSTDPEIHWAGFAAALQSLNS
jgi:subtilase family serine protease